MPKLTRMTHLRHRCAVRFPLSVPLLCYTSLPPPRGCSQQLPLDEGIPAIRANFLNR